jgi:hypothetical protein
MKKGGLIFLFFILFFAGFSVAETVADNIPIQIQTLDASNNVISGTFTFKIDISDSSTCSPVLYSNTTVLTTDSRGIVSYSLPNVNLDFSEQYWFCYYRDSVLKSTIKAARVPYAFRAKNVSLSGVGIDTNLEMGSYNVSANYFIGDGSYLTNLPLGSESDPYWTGNQSSYFNKTDIISFGYYNLSSFDISDYALNSSLLNYYLSSNPFGFYNETNLPSFTEDLWNANYSTYLTLFNWNKTYADSLYYGIGNPSNFIDWSKATNGTLALSSELNNYYLSSNPFGFYNSTTLPVTSSVWNRSSTNVFLANTGDNVGIGTSSPIHKLDVNTSATEVGIAHITANGTKVYTYVSSDSGELRINNADGENPVTLKANGISWFNGGNVGIGTTNPSSKLDINSAGANGLILNQDTTSADFSSRLFFKANSSNYAIVNYNNKLSFTSNANPGVTSGSVKMTLDSSGKVGIGTNSPTQKLSVSGGVNIWLG